MSSIEAHAKFFDAEDWQLKKTEHSYESSKYQIDILATTLDQLQLTTVPESQKRIRHLVAQPGVCSTQISHSLIGPVLEVVKVVLFYLVCLCCHCVLYIAKIVIQARFLGSQNHTIVPYKAAISTVYLTIVSLSFLSSTARSTPKKDSAKSESGSRPVRYGSQTDRRGAEYIGVTEVKEWETHQDQARDLLDKCDELYQSILAEGSRDIEIETASERM